MSMVMLTQAEYRELQHKAAEAERLTVMVRKLRDAVTLARPQVDWMCQQVIDACLKEVRP